MSAYKKGRRVEHYIKSLLKELGAVYIIRSAGSRGLADLVAIFPLKKEIWLIQVKGGKNTPSLSFLREKYKGLRELEGVYILRSKIAVKKGNRYIIVDIK